MIITIFYFIFLLLFFLKTKQAERETVLLYLS